MKAKFGDQQQIEFIREMESRDAFDEGIIKLMEAHSDISPYVMAKLIKDSARVYFDDNGDIDDWLIFKAELGRN